MAVTGEDNFSVQGFSGIYLDQDPQFIEDTEMESCINFLIGKNGVLQKRKPVQQFSTLVGSGSVIDTVEFVGELIRETQTYSFFHDRGANQCYFTTGSSTTMVLIPELSGQIIWGACQYIKEMFLACESHVFVWTPDGGASVITSSPPGLRQIIILNDRLFGMVRSELYWSEPGEPQTWLPDSVLMVNDGDGDDITCLIPYQGHLVIFKNSSTWALYFADDPLFWILNWLNFDVGCRGPHAAKLYRNVIYVIDRNACWATDTVTYKKISDPIDTFFKDSKMLLVQLDIFSDHVSVYKDWVIFHQKFGGDWAYRTTPPQGFTTLVWNAPNSGGTLPNYLWFPLREQKLHGRNGRFIGSIGNRIYELVEYDTPGNVEQVTSSFVSKSYDMGRISRIKRIKHSYLTIGASSPTTQGLQYGYKIDGISAGYSNLNTLPAPNITQDVNLRGSEFDRVVAFQFREAVPNPSSLRIFAFNFVSMLHRQQSENAQ